uniref:Thiosulfate/3-mercaptopyruvate sulfurtransferase n=1 Tax=Candidatus Kentrum sp. TUN TaxID=2126343 RepID=A0A450ZQW6_9GAMM|nr:MAG: thiosulfate/3-mercaptopyruvate sulfurtransferase [Candidatus Kentron sp. TUN]VFK54141.1 MAG: thiosulfate/3-mercaptopyruvate sulfurtransferase [Candidatus Kentron sp. TUN]VFK56166.1 MAG: thiosulfate/3-mercaptopyruvate sulfurtransferase [Candidatus Kentron sp. TUN]
MYATSCIKGSRRNFAKSKEKVLSMKIHKSFRGIRFLAHDRKVSWLVAFLCLAWLVGGGTVSATTLPGPVVDTAWLAKNLDNVIVLDARKDLKSFAKEREKTAGPVNPCGPGGKKAKKPVRGNGHIPGAVLVNLKKIFSGYKLNGKAVKVMLPKKENFEKLMQRSGVSKDSAVVITGKGEKLANIAFMTRLYWTMKYFGFDNVAILNGGTVQWKLDKHNVEYGRSRKPKKGNFTVSVERKEILASMENVSALSQGEGKEQILDVRAKPFYLGLTYRRKFQSPKSKGHIPTAKSFPAAFLVDTAAPSTMLYNKEDIEKVAALSGIDLIDTPTVTSCHTGVKASLAWFVLSEILENKSVRVYDGSMHEWSIAGKPVTRPID